MKSCGSFYFLNFQFASDGSFTVCEFGSFFGMPAALKHGEDGGTETRRFLKIAEQGIGSAPKLQSLPTSGANGTDGTHGTYRTFGTAKSRWSRLSRSIQAKNFAD
jgi:hypothetical protein